MQGDGAPFFRCRRAVSLLQEAVVVAVGPYLLACQVDAQLDVYAVDMEELAITSSLVEERNGHEHSRCDEVVHLAHACLLGSEGCGTA